MRLIYLAKQCGLTERQAWRTVPGRIIKLWRWKREYDEYLHGIRWKQRKARGEID